METQFYENFPLLVSKKESPGLSDKPYVYLDNAATTHKPSVVLEAIEGYYQEHNANPYRGAYQLSTFSTKLYESAREFVADFIGASKNEVIFTRNTTEALNIVAFSYALNILSKGDQIALPISEHHSNLVIWQQICDRVGATLVYMYPDKQGRLSEEEITRAITEKTKLVAFAHVSNVLGSINPVEAIVKRAQEVGAITVLDCAQSVAHMPLDLHSLNVDFAAFSGHKMYAPMGIGVLYAKSDRLEEMTPFLFGGEMIDEVYDHSSTFEEGPKRFEAGTPNVEGALGLATAMHYLHSIGFETISTIEKALSARLIDGMQSMDDLVIYGNNRAESDRSGVIAFNIKGTQPSDVAYIFDTENIAIRSGSHCTHPLHRFLGIRDSCRASLCFYNTTEDIDRFLDVLTKVRRQISQHIMTFFP